MSGKKECVREVVSRGAVAARRQVLRKILVIKSAATSSIRENTGSNTSILIF